MKILVADDHADSARATGRLLTAVGHDVRVVNGCTPALELAARWPFDLLLADIELRDGDGCDLLPAVRAMPGNDRVSGIVLSGHGTPDVVRRCLDVGFAAHLLKPIQFDQLTDAIQNLSGRN